VRDQEHSLCHTIKLGLIPYNTARDLQVRFAKEIAAGFRPPTLLLLEHPHMFTFGRRGEEQNLLWSAEELRERDVEIHRIDRGGDVTYHGPGQLVGYPLIPLGEIDTRGHIPQSDYIGYVRRLEKVLIISLAELGLAAGQIQGLTGVWVQPDVASRCPRCPPAAREVPSKIASIGVKVDAQGISRHGFSLNVHPDMSFWEGIVACGLADYPSVALADLLELTPSMEEVQELVTASFGKVFQYDMVEESLDAQVISK
jgi:lipoyl(octanoyl) transferase